MPKAIPPQPEWVCPNSGAATNSRGGTTTLAEDSQKRKTSFMCPQCRTQFRYPLPKAGKSQADRERGLPCCDSNLADPTMMDLWGKPLDAPVKWSCPSVADNHAGWCSMKETEQ